MQQLNLTQKINLKLLNSNPNLNNFMFDASEPEIEMES